MEMECFIKKSAKKSEMKNKKMFYDENTLDRCEISMISHTDNFSKRLNN